MKFLMATSFALMALAPALSQAQSSSPRAACRQLFVGELAWRSGSTQPNQSGGVSETSAAREGVIRRTEQWQVSMLDGSMLGKGDTPPMYLVPAEGVNAREVVRSGGLNGVLTRMSVSGLGPSGIFRGTLLLPVSGHTGMTDAKRWAKSDTYRVTLQYPKGAADKFDDSYSYPGTNLVDGTKSLDLVTKQELEIPLKPGLNRLVYYRSGSTGPAGYREGRLILIEWDGK